MSRYNNVTCINCFVKGHTFKNCKYPITSYGIIVYKKVNDVFNFLLVQRKDTMGYIDFIRGKYNNKKDDVFKNLLGEMTIDEKKKLLKSSFTDLWNELWLNHESRIYKNDYEYSKKKYNKLDILPLILDSIYYSKWTEQEYSIPKGRRNNYENVLNCAIREFCEESGYSPSDIDIKYNIKPIEEFFVGSNGIPYKHVYYIAELVTDKKPILDYNNISQIGEIKHIQWFDYKQTMNIFRNYEVTKRNVIHTLHSFLTSSLL